MAKTLNLSEDDLTTLFRAYAALVEQAYRLLLTSDTTDEESFNANKAAWMAKVDEITAAVQGMATEEPTDAETH